MSERRLRPAAFIDRDGVINVERDYVHKIEDFELLPGAMEGMRLLQQLGYLLVVVTNQAGIGRGYYTEAQFAVLTQHMTELLAAGGVHLEGVYHCPHHPAKGIGPYAIDCDCRKPKPGMILRAARELDLDLPASILVGDKSSDIGAGRAASVGRCILVRTGHALTEADCDAADACVSNLPAAARWAGAAKPV